VQSYLRRTTDDLDTLLSDTTAVRLVKGAYNEPANVAFARKADVDGNYLTCARTLLARAQGGIIGFVPAFATHDVRIIREIVRIADEMKVPRSDYEFQMLYGINTAEQQRLAAEGFRMRVLISYGAAWFAWYMRRLAERPANVWFLLKSIV
jgi:proline dehydrogenase